MKLHTLKPANGSTQTRKRIGRGPGSGLGGTSNPHNLVKATIQALGEMRDARTVAQHRGVSLDKVFRG